MKFKLKDQSELQISEHVQFYARALRAIGQDLSSLFPHSMEITATAMDFEVVGHYVPRDLEKLGPRDTHLLGKLRQKLWGETSDAAAPESQGGLVPFRRTYTPADIDRLDEASCNQRTGRETAPDIYSLGEILRMVGRIIDSNGKRLHKLSRDNYGVRFEYEDGSGEMQRREVSNLQLYKLQQQYYGERGAFIPVDHWEGSI
ncbi:MAG TPA: hypothetical protein VHM64_25160 [Candidatus Binatia bacterium]|nr:hypothetical protein [Candidatus Binatia bacterium]